MGYYDLTWIMGKKNMHNYFSYILEKLLRLPVFEADFTLTAHCKNTYEYERLGTYRARVSHNTKSYILVDARTRYVPRSS